MGIKIAYVKYYCIYIAILYIILGEKVMVNNVNSSSSSPASKLLEQIKRLSAETTKNEGSYLNRKNNVISDYANNIKNLQTLEKTQKLEEIQKKAEISAQMIEDIKKENKERYIQLQEVPKQINPEKRYREPIGTFLDVYL